MPFLHGLLSYHVHCLCSAAGRWKQHSMKLGHALQCVTDQCGSVSFLQCAFPLTTTSCVCCGREVETTSFEIEHALQHMLIIGALCPFCYDSFPMCISHSLCYREVQALLCECGHALCLFYHVSCTLCIIFIHVYTIFCIHHPLYTPSSFSCRPSSVHTIFLMLQGGGNSVP